MMNQFQRLKQPQAQAPQTPPTIKDQLNMLDQQQQMQRQQGNIQQMQAPAPQPSPMDRGLGAIDAGNMEYPQFAGGGVVALAGGGEPDLEAEVHRILQKSPVFRTPEENEILRAAGRQLSRRELPSDSGISKVDKYLGQIFGDEQETRPAQTPTVTPSQSAVPPAAPAAAPPAAPALGGAGFDQQIAAARAGVQQDMPPAVPPAASPFAPPSGAGVPKNRFDALIKQVEGRKFEETADSFSPEEQKRIEKALAGLGGEKQDAVRMALAQAGFRMAAAAARGGRERTSFLGAAAEGALGGMQQYTAAQKELRQTEKELNKEMASLRRYQDEVARGERNAKRSFEEKKEDRIADLTARRESALISQAEIASRERIASQQYGANSGQNEYRRSALTINMLDPMYKAAVERLNAVTDFPPVGIKPQSPEHKAAIAAAQKKVSTLESQMRAAASGGIGGVPLTGGSGPYSSMSDDALRKALGI
jgi:hypothetical protein